MEFSWIQKHVLLLLIRSRAARVKDLQPSDVPANQFSYHLDGLVSQGLIVKKSRGTYTLTTKGEKLVGTFSTALDKQVENIKTVVMLYGKRGDEYLLFRWSRQPYLSQVTPLYDRMPIGKPLDAGINSALNDKLGARCDVTFKMSALIRIVHDEEIISHMNALIYEVSLDGVELPFTSRNGEALIARLDQDGCMNGVSEFFTKLETASEPFESAWYY
jgi:hypothetical protein